MPNALRTKLQEHEFYCVSCRKRVRARKDDICIQTFKNKRVRGGVPAMRSECSKCYTNLTKFIKRDSKAKMTNKYGKC